MITLVIPAVGGHVKLLEQTIFGYASGVVVPAKFVVVTDGDGHDVVKSLIPFVEGMTNGQIKSSQMQVASVSSVESFVNGLKNRTADRGLLRSEGLKEADTPYVAFGEADCVPGPKCLHAHLAALLKSDTPIYTSCGALARLTPKLSKDYHPLSANHDKCVEYCRTLKDNQRAYFREKDGWRGALAVMPTKYARFAMGYQPNRKGFGAEELKFFDRIEMLGLKEVRVPEPMLHQWHPREFNFDELNANHYDMKFFNQKYKKLLKTRLDDVLSLDWTTIPTLSDFDTDEEAWKWLENALPNNSASG